MVSIGPENASWLLPFEFSGLYLCTARPAACNNLRSPEVRGRRITKLSRSGSTCKVCGLKRLFTIWVSFSSSGPCDKVSSGDEIVAFVREDARLCLLGMRVGMLGMLPAEAIDQRPVSRADGTDEGAVEGAVDARFRLS